MRGEPVMTKNSCYLVGLSDYRDFIMATTEIVIFTNMNTITIVDF